MPIRKNILRKGTAPKQNLLGFDVLQEETGVLGDLSTSKFFKISEFPSVLPTGNSSFLIEGSDLLKPNVELKTEILDSQGNPIFHYGIPNYDRELPARRMTIEVYDDDVVNGVGSFTMLGELDPRKVSIPTEFQDTYNVRFTAPISINKAIKNTRPIRFYGDPTLSVSELVKGVVEKVYTGNQKTATITGSVEVNTPEGGIPVMTPPGDKSAIPFGDSSQISEVGNAQSSYISKTKGEAQSSIFPRPIMPYRRRDNKPTYVVKAMEAGIDNADDKITGTMEGATLTINSPHNLVDSSRYPDSKWTKPTTFSTKILKVINSTTFRTNTFYKIQSKNNNSQLVVPLQPSGSQVSITHNVGSVVNTASQIFQRSYANMTVGNLQTFSGDTYKAKVYMKEDGSSSEFEKIYETLVESPNELIDQNSDTGFKSVGIFPTQSIVDNFWVTSSATFTATQDDDTIIDGVILSGSTEPNANSFTFETSQSYSFEKNEPYLIDFDVAFKPTNKVQSDGTTKKDAKLEVFLTGPIVSETGQEFPLGEVELNEYDFNKINTFTIVKKKQVTDFLTHNETNTPSGSLGFRVSSGEFILSDVRLRPFSETNFSPGFFKANVPMPKAIKRGQAYDFVVEFYDANNSLAEAVAIADDVTFQGPPQIVADGQDALLTGSLFISNVVGSGIEMHGGSAYIRSVGYHGFHSASFDAGSGFMMFSGSVSKSLNTSESYDGVGIELIDNSGANPSSSRFLKFRTNAEGEQSEFEVRTDNFLFGVKGTANNYISGSNGNLEISSSNFALQEDGDVILQGTITAEAGGTIGGFDIGSSTISTGTGANFIALDSTNKKLRIGAKASLTDSNTGVHVSTDGIALGASSVFKVTNAGAVTAGNLTITGGSLSVGSGDDIFRVDTDGDIWIGNATQGSAPFQVTKAGVITATSGTIGGWTLGSTLSATNILLDPATPKITLGSKATLTDSNTGAYIGTDGIALGASSVFKVTNAGAVTATSGVVGGWTLGSTLSATNILLDPSTPKITLGSKATLTDSNTGLYLGTDGIALGASSVFKVTSAGAVTAGNITATGGTIGGFTITDAVIESSDFVSGVKGVRISTAQNGMIEAENARIRGTLSTTTFEKETVNAVGGQLLVANSTMITGSAAYHSDTSMSVANVTGFTTGEVLMIKEVSSTGFNTEYLRVHSASRDSTDDNNLTGKLFVTRSYSNTTVAATGSEGFRGEAFGNSGSYEPGQVVVSTGLSGSGYIRLNANPRDLSTPYIDIIERTGSGIYDTELKARLGDLSGLSYSTVGTTTPGFGLYSENVFLTGTITATSGSIGGINMHSGKLFVGTGTFGNDNTKFFVDENGDFSLGDKFVWDQSEGTLNIDGTITVGSMNGAVSGAAQIAADISGSAVSGSVAAMGTAATGVSGSAAAATDAATGITNAATAQTQANTATTNAATAQTAIDLMETRVVIDNTGMALKAKSDAGSLTLNGQTIAEYGTTTTLYDGVADATANKKLEMNASGITLWGGTSAGNDYLNLAANSIVIKANNLKKFEATDAGVFVYGLAENDYVNVKSDRVDVVAAGTDVASFGAITRIGDVANEHISASSTGITIKDGSATMASYGATSKIFDATDNNTYIEVGGGSIDIISGSVTGSSFGAATSSFFGTGSNKHDRLEIVGEGLKIYKNNSQVASYGTNTVLTGGSITLQGTTGTIGDEKLVIANNSITIDSAGAEVFNVTGGTITLKTGTSSHEKLVMSDASIAMYSANAKLIDITDGSINIGPAANAGNAVIGNVRLGSGGAFIYGAAVDDYVNVKSNAVDVVAAGKTVATLAATTKIGVDENDSTFVQIDSDSVDIIEDVSGTNTTVASFGIATTIGNTSGQHISIDANSIDIKTAANVTVMSASADGIFMSGSINAGAGNIGGWTISDTKLNKLSGSSSDVNAGIILDSTNNQIIVSGSGAITANNSVILKGNDGIIEVSQSGAGVFDTGRTQVFTTTTIVEPQVFKPGTGRTFNTASVTTVTEPTPTSNNINVLGTAKVGQFVQSKGLLIDKTSAASGTGGTFFQYQHKKNHINSLHNDGAAIPTASFAAATEWNYSGMGAEYSGSSTHPDFHFHSEHFTELGTAGTVGWVKNSVTSGSNIFTISSKLQSYADDDFADAKFNLLGLEANTSQIALARQNEYTFLQAKHSGSIRVQIQHDGDIVSKGNITAFGTSFLTVSDEREKKDIYTISESLDRILELQPRKFTWKETNKQDVGFIAQEVEKIIPEVIETSRGFINTDNDQERKTIAYPKLVPYLVDTIQVMEKRIKELEKKVK